MPPELKPNQQHVYFCEGHVRSSCAAGSLMYNSKMQEYFFENIYLFVYSKIRVTTTLVLKRG